MFFSTKTHGAIHDPSDLQETQWEQRGPEGIAPERLMQFPFGVTPWSQGLQLRNGSGKKAGQNSEFLIAVGVSTNFMNYNICVVKLRLRVGCSINLDHDDCSN